MNKEVNEIKKKAEEIEKQLREIQKVWIESYEKITRIIQESKATDYIKDQKHDND